MSNTMMTRSKTCIAELEARIAELEKENEALKKKDEFNGEFYGNLPGHDNFPFDWDEHLEIITMNGYKFEDGEWKRDGWKYCEDESEWVEDEDQVVELNDKKDKVSKFAYELIKEWELDGKDLMKITGTGKGGAIISGDLQFLVQKQKYLWEKESTDEDTDEEDEESSDEENSDEDTAETIAARKNIT